VGLLLLGGREVWYNDVGEVGRERVLVSGAWAGWGSRSTRSNDNDNKQTTNNSNTQPILPRELAGKMPNNGSIRLQRACAGWVVSNHTASSMAGVDWGAWAPEVIE